MSSTPGFVTPEFTTIRDTCTKGGRPRKHATPAERQKAYRDRQAQDAGFMVGTPVHHRTYGEGLVLMASEDLIYVAFPESEDGSDPRRWFHVPRSTLTITGCVRKKLPRWTDPEISDTKKPYRTEPLRWSNTNIALATMEGVNVRDIRVYLKTKAGKRRKYKDFSNVINDRIAYLVGAAKGEL